jgi:DNA-binding MarR family transcriptional regulator
MSLTRQEVSPAELGPAELAAWRGFLRAYAVLVPQLDADLRAQHGIGLSAYELLRFLDDAPGDRLRPGELAAAALLTPSGVTRLCDRLVRDGLVVRESCDEDGRGTEVVLTDRGRERVRAARTDHLAGVRERFLDPLNPDEIAALGAVWARVAGEPAP